MTSDEVEIAAITISGNRQREAVGPADLLAWSELARRLGPTTCIWAGPRLLEDGPQFRILRSPRHPGLRGTPWLVVAVFRGLCEARRARRSGRLVVLNGGEPWGWLAASIVASIARRPFVMDIHGDFFSLPAASVGGGRSWLLKLAVGLFSRIASERRVVSANMVDEMSVRGLSASLVPPRLTPVWDQALTRPPRGEIARGPALLVVGRLVASKGYDLLISALAEVRDVLPLCTLTIVGDGPQRHALEEQAAQCGLATAVRFVGRADVEQVRREMSLADIFVISSRDEGLPRTLLEAAAAGLPVVATSVGGIPAAAAEWESTVELVAVDPSSIAEGIVRVAKESPPSEELDRRRAQVLAEYGFTVNIDALAALYRRVVADHVAR